MLSNKINIQVLCFLLFILQFIFFATLKNLMYAIVGSSSRQFIQMTKGKINLHFVTLPRVIIQQ